MTKRRVFFNRLLECWISQTEEGLWIRCATWNVAFQHAINFPWPSKTLIIRKPVRYAT